MNDFNMGIFLCDCGGQLEASLDLQLLEQQVRYHPLTADVRRLRYACSPEGCASIRRTIQEQKLDRIVIAGCTERLMGRHFREACAQIGMDGEYVNLVDIREGCAWVHADLPQAATEKALALIRMGMVNCAWRQARQALTMEVAETALVLGGGLCGMTAALTMAGVGIPVTLVERESRLGGMLGNVFPLPSNHRDASQTLKKKIDAVMNHDLIRVYLESRVVGISGAAGRYHVHVQRKNSDGSADLDFEVGAIVVATGARIQQPLESLLPGDHRIVSQQTFACELQRAVEEEPVCDLPQHVVMLLCENGPGGRHADDRTGLSGIAALEQAIEIKKLQPQSDVSILFHELTLPNGKNSLDEILEAQKLGVELVHVSPSSCPEIDAGFITVHDHDNGIALRLTYDRLIVSSPIVSQPDSGVLAHMLKLAQDEQGFFYDRRYRLLPEAQCERGVYVCGAAHYPTRWREAEFQAASAAFQAIRHIRSDTLIRRIATAQIDEERCTGCGTCVANCPFEAISLRSRGEVLNLAQVDPLLCKSCGNCVVMCSVKAIDLPLERDVQIYAEIEEALAHPSGASSARVIMFCCEWSGQVAVDLAGARKMRYSPEIRPIRIGCSARFDPAHALWAFLHGADGVFIAACPPGTCHYIDGNRRALQRIEELEHMLLESGFDPRRLKLAWIKPDEPQEFVNTITAFTDLVRALGPRSSENL